MTTTTVQAVLTIIQIATTDQIARITIVTTIMDQIVTTIMGQIVTPVLGQIVITTIVILTAPIRTALTVIMDPTATTTIATISLLAMEITAADLQVIRINIRRLQQLSVMLPLWKQVMRFRCKILSS